MPTTSGRQREYRKVTAGSSLAKRQSLWLGSDHLLLVNTFYIIEQYRRFFYRDLQAVVIQRTVGWAWWLGAMALLLAPSLAGLLIVEEFVWRVVLGCVAGWGALGLVAGLLIGPSCRCVIQTSAGVEPLPLVSTLRKARKLIRLIEARVAQAQPPLTDAEREAAIPAAPPAFAAPPPPLPFAIARAATADPWTRAMFAALLAFAAWQVATIFAAGLALAAADTLIYVVLVAFAVAAVIRQRRQAPTKTVRLGTWITVGVIVAVAVASYLEMIIASVKHPDFAGNSWLMFRHAAQQRALDAWPRLVMHVLFAAVSGIVGGVGLLAASRTGAPGTEAPPRLTAP